MSKMIVYILDKFVWMLLVAVLTTQALQIAGVVESPKASTLGDTVYSNNNQQFEYKISMRDQNRLRRQAGDRSPLLDSLFNVPIATLTAVNELLQSSRPVFQRFREAAQKGYDATKENLIRYQRANQQKFNASKVQREISPSPSPRFQINV